MFVNRNPLFDSKLLNKKCYEKSYPKLKNMVRFRNYSCRIPFFNAIHSKLKIYFFRKFYQNLKKINDVPVPVPRLVPVCRYRY